jgi:superfamily II DNA/RNA helicase
MTFTELGIKNEFTRTLGSRNIKEPSEIQRLVIPALLASGPSGMPEGSAATSDASAVTSGGSAATSGGSAGAVNLLFSSPTGTGKTLAYALPLLQQMARYTEGPAGGREDFSREFRRGPELFVLAPTYELASQIKKELDALLPAAFGGSPDSAADTISPVPRSTLLIGSAPFDRQIDALKKHPAAVVGNPARVLQLVRMKKLSLRALRRLVLDEGDRLVADELFPETAELCRLAFPPGTPAADDPALRERRIIACSATFSGKNRERLFSLAPDARWEIVTQKENDILRKNIEHWAFFAEEREKTDLLRSFMAAAKPAKALVFTSRASQVGRIVFRLQNHGLAAAGLWGDMDKKARKAAMDGFRKGNIPILVSSDLTARGLDVDRISHIIALDIPDSEETYIHRAGRTARAGRRGIMASFGDEEELRRLARIEKKLGIAVFPKALYAGRVLPA